MATTLNDQIKKLSETIGNDIKTIKAAQGDLSQLTTGEKASLVGAINELNATLVQIDKNLIDDGQTVVNKTWSSSKISSEIIAKANAVKDQILGGAGEAFDTLSELKALIDNNKNLIDSLTQLAGSHVRYDEAQQLSPEQKKQARDNISAADSEELATVKSTANAAKTQSDTNKTSIGTLTNLQTTAKGNLVAAVNEVKGVADAAKSEASAAKKTADKVNNDLTAFKTAVGPTDTDFAKIYTDTRDGVGA